MGVGILPMARREIDIAHYPSDGKGLVRLLYDDLARVAEVLHITPLEQFIVDVPLADFEREGRAPTEEEIQAFSSSYEERWYPTQDGLQTIRSLQAAIASHPDWLTRRQGAQDAIEELEALATWLHAAGEDNAFYLLVA